MRASSRTLATLAASLLAAAALDGCASSDPGTRWSRHFDAPVWGGALGQQVERPDRLGPEAVLLASVGAAFVYEHNHPQDVSGSGVDSTTGDVASALQVVLPAIPVTVGIVEWAQGDGGRRFEVVAESLAGVVLTQQVLANLVGRERPNGEDDKSFPSGHTSWAFASTTLIVRGLHDPADDSFHLVDGLIYLPALLSAGERIANDKHFPSDVAAGAFLGVFLTNWIWDAHYRSEDESRATVFEHARRRGIVWSPYVGEIDGQIVLGFKGEF